MKRTTAFLTGLTLVLPLACGPQADYAQAERAHEQREEDRQKQLQEQMKQEQAAGLEPSKLLGGEWVCVTIGGKAAGGGRAPTLTFGDDGRVTGFSGVNRFSTDYTSARGVVRFGQMVSTKMASDPDRMALERSFLEALTKVDSFSVEAGLLRLQQGKETLVEFSH
ncbi:MAG: META domain-containing protein [Planctomycetes bacterium]|nr:META domain-containing protein [Planctomycetota bacterium]